jgi:hypothetical protein
LARCDFNAVVTIEEHSEQGTPHPIRIAYIILAHHRPEATVRLVRRLHAPDHDFFIHYNRRSPDAEFDRLAKELCALGNVRLLERHKCTWGDAGMVRGALKGIAEVARMGFVHDYTILLTGQDYPIRSDAQFRERLRAAAGGSFMEWAAYPVPNWQNGREIKRIETYYVHLPFPLWARPLGWPPGRQHLSVPLKRKIPGGLHPHFGSAFWYLHRSCIQYVHQYVMDHPDYVRFFDHAMVPDECFFQTLLMNSPLAPTIAKGALTYIHWRPPWPGILTMADLPRILASDCLLARKFDPAVDREVLDQLDKLAAKL